MQGETLGPCVLEGEFVRLEPLKENHLDELVEAGKGFDWAWMSMDLTTSAAMSHFIESALAKQREGVEYPLVVRYKQTNKIVGSTRYMDVNSSQKGVEIGWTWYSPQVWGTVVNPECKYLLLKHAFEDWKAIRVYLKTDNYNLHSQRAILKLGAKFEGMLRNHRIRRDGTYRHTMVYSILPEEWVDVKAGLLKRIDYLQKRSTPQSTGSMNSYESVQ
ncbi:MAG: GNAT family N-acetyltransferase [Nitrososphaerota archaeon]|nr:GNAT family N-acetyltransferase [Nitrososphaerota archaeon]